MRQRVCENALHTALGAPGCFSTVAMVPSDMDSPMEGTAMSLPWRRRRVSHTRVLQKVRPRTPARPHL